MKKHFAFGTSHFQTRGAAYKYFSKQGEDHAAVDNKLKEKIISLGPPQVKTNQKITLDEDRRYWVEETPMA